MSGARRREVVDNFRLCATQRKLIDFHRGTVIHVFDVTDCPSRVRRLVLDETGQVLECGCVRDGRSSLTKNAVRVLLEETLLECDLTMAPKDYEKWARFTPGRPEAATRRGPALKPSSRAEQEEERRKEEREAERLAGDRRAVRVREALCPIKVSLDLLHMPGHTAARPPRRESPGDKFDEFPASRVLSKEFCDAPPLGDPLVAIKGALRRLPREIVAEALRASENCSMPPVVAEPQPRPAPRFAMQNVRPRRKANWPPAALQGALLPNVKGATVSRSSMGAEP